MSPALLKCITGHQARAVAVSAGSRYKHALTIPRGNNPIKNRKEVGIKVKAAKHGRFQKKKKQARKRAESMNIERTELEELLDSNWGLSTEPSRPESMNKKHTELEELWDFNTYQGECIK